jgi:hypothetical protein
MAEIAHMRGLLGEMGRLSAGNVRAPTRLEGIRNDMWHDMQKLAGSETSQDRIEKHWNGHGSGHAGLLKKLTSGSTARDDLWTICKEVDPSRKPTVAKAQLDAFIDGCRPSQLQLMFEKMIKQWVWRERMMNAWGIK